MRPETRKQNIHNIKTLLVDLWNQTSKKWVDNKELPIADILSTYIGNNGNLRSFTGKYIMSNLLKKEDNGRSFKYTWGDSGTNIDFEFTATKIVDQFIQEFNKKKLSPLPQGKHYRKLEETPKDREFNLNENIFILWKGIVCEAIVRSKSFPAVNLEKSAPEDLIYTVVFRDYDDGFTSTQISSNMMYKTINELFDGLRVNVRKLS